MRVVGITRGLRIFLCRGRLLLWTPFSTGPLVAQPLDVAIIGLLAAGQDPEELLTGTYRWFWAGQPVTRRLVQVQAAIRRLGTAGYLADVGEPEARPDSFFEGTQFKSLTAQRVASSVSLKLQKNACFQLLGKEFVFSSRLVRQPCQIPLNALLFSLNFAGGRTLSEVISATGVGEIDGLRMTGRLLSSALLVPTRPDTEIKTESIRKAMMHTVQLGSDDPWSGIEPDDRKPIYFVTHSKDHLPLALGMIRSYIETFENGKLLEHYHLLPIVSMMPTEMHKVFERFGPGVWLFSNYMWSIHYNLEYSEAVKAELGPENVTIHGGPSTPKYEKACQRFMDENPHIDYAVRGEGEITVAELLSALATVDGGRTALEGIASITYRSGTDPLAPLVRTGERLRAMDVDQFPSPYLNCAFNDYGGEVVAAILETNRGCPYGCTFCDWGSATQQKIRRFDMDRISQEIDWIGRNQIRVLWIADANFGIFNRDIEITQCIADTKEKYGYPREVVVNYPKNATKKIAEVVKILVAAGICGQGIISIQTTDTQTLKIIRRDNIKTSKYDELEQIFRSQNLPLSTDLMIGLPGATVESFKGDLQYYFDHDVTVKAYRTQLLPNSPMADPGYMSEYAIQTDTDGFLISTSSYTEQELDEINWIWATYDVLDCYGLLRYVLRYVQWDHGIRAIDFVHRLSIEARNNPTRYPTLNWFQHHFLRERFAPGGWVLFYSEIRDFVEQNFGVQSDTGLETALLVNELMMPDEGREFPEVVSLEHDYAAYSADHARNTGENKKRLRSYGRGTLSITDPFGLCHMDYEFLEQYDSHQVFYELDSEISRLRSDPSFVKHRNKLIV